MNTLVSIVIPTFRRPNMIERAVRSALNQSYEPVEVIVVDDNDPLSPERRGTESVLSGFDEDPRVIYVKHDRNRNGSAARNTGWRVARGEYITFLDDDDEISPLKIQRQVECLETLDESWGACYTAYHTLMKDGSVQRSTTSEYGDVYLRALMRTLYVGSGSNLLFRKCVVDEIGGYDESFRRNQDIEFMARAFENYKVAFVNEDLLTIHWEVRDAKRDYDFTAGVALYYLERMKERINRLPSNDRHRVLAVIALDRARIALYHRKYGEIVRILCENDVRVSEVMRYLVYLFNRVITKRSYGFYLN